MPNNSIFWGQAAVNNSNGFGSGASNNTNDWGKIHAITYGHDETNLTGSPSIRYLGAVLADGGTVDSVGCVSRSFYNLDQIPVDISDQALFYKIAVENDNGTLDNVRCVSTSFTNLDNIIF